MINTQLYIESICIYKDIINDEIFLELEKLCDYLNSEEKLNLKQSIKLYNDFAYKLLASDSNMDLVSYTINKVILKENLVSKYVESGKIIDDHLVTKIKNELNYLQLVANTDSNRIKEIIIEKACCSEIEKEIINGLIDWNCSDNLEFYNIENKDIYNIYLRILKSENWGDNIEIILESYKKYGTGDFALYRAFVWENSNLRKVEEPDGIKLHELIGYEWQKEVILDNTLKFLKGYSANNMLLYGSRGTGKSSTVKALVNEYYKEGLRLIQVDKEQLVDFPRIINILKNKNHKFIIFVDDLVFEENEPAYSALKTILEGKVENRPRNILIYATTNRKHLVKETFNDRQGMGAGDSEEIHPKDTMEEKLSLADRFGITVTFISPNQKEFLNIVDGIIKNRGISVEEDYLHQEALKWERTHNGRSPRTATQFVDWLEGEEGLIR